MGKFGKLAGIAGLCACLLTGCGEAGLPETADAPMVVIDKAGQITLHFVEEFDKAYYDLAELAGMAAEEVSQYNGAVGGEPAVALGKVAALEGGRVTVSYRFSGWKSCADFTGDVLFYGTVGDAVSNGFSVDVPMRRVKDNALCPAGQLRQAQDRRLVITGLAAYIYCPGKAAYVSDGAAVKEDGSIYSGGTEGLVYILLQ